MGDLVTLRQGGQITLPKRVREQLNLGRGDHFRVDVKSDDTVVLRLARVPVYGSPEAKIREKEALKEIKTGQVHSFESTNDLLAFLKLPRDQAKTSG